MILLNDKRAVCEMLRCGREKGTTRLGTIVVVVLLVAAGATTIFFGMGRDKLSIETGSTYKVTRGDLRISVVESGNLKAKKSVEIECDVEGRATIVYLIPEGTFVKEGELLVELDSSDLEERLTTQEISYESAKASLVQAEENLKIQDSQNTSDILAGELAVRFAQNELDKFLKDGSLELERKQLENNIIIADAELKRAQDRVEWTRKLEEKGFVTSDELEADELTLERRVIDLFDAREQKRLSEKYDFPMNEEKLRADLQEANLELDRINRRAKSQIAQKEADKNSKKAQYDLQDKRLKKLEEQYESCTVHAPQDGLVIYGEQGGGGRMGRDDDDMIEEGTEVRFRQTLITLPDVSIMMVDCDVHESAIDKVDEGMDAVITIDAFQDESYKGTVTKVAILPDSQSRWLNPDLKVYSTDVTMEGGNGKLKPGMSAKVEIICKELKQVIYIPIQSVYRRGGREVCYVRTPAGGIEVRTVKVGMNNEQFVEITSGLEQGEVVLLYAPIMGVEDQADKEAEEGDGKEPPGNKTRGRKQDGATSPDGGPGGGHRNMGGREMSPEARKMMEKYRNMSPEERQKAVEKLRSEGKMPSSFGGRGSGGAERGGMGGDREGSGEGQKNGSPGSKGSHGQGGK